MLIKIDRAVFELQAPKAVIKDAFSIVVIVSLQVTMEAILVSQEHYVGYWHSKYNSL